jgi:hypothetical protein
MKTTQNSVFCLAKLALEPTRVIFEDPVSPLGDLMSI